ncbi:alpha/beta fold hydrolase [Amycolatopsis eburnea]|uniref:Alpha/beta fold hydrolase n=1 Tax=Amycolatopsis eburnea TaxID=2267691 RepID=A0A3R9KJZ1_9PSEU|nr:alpha/beta fold hydrolase [Amycolatopsis eburnea]RSD16330.1 alpha/beta fold hydrolase [Amycolatopsis eburnea]
MQVEQLEVECDGALLYVESRGQGTPVLLIQGGIGEAGATEQLAAALADRFCVVSYDRRGLSRSTTSDPGPVTMRRHAADAGAVLAASTSEPAHVVGASIGALIGLHLVASEPHRVATLVAHEPPMSAVVLDPARETALDQVAATAQEDVRAAIRQMGSLTGARESMEDGARPAPPAGDVMANLQRFFGHDFPAVRSSSLVADDLADSAKSTNIVLTGGDLSRGQWEYRCAEQLAGELGVPFAELPGGHNGLVSHPKATAAAITRILDRVALAS